MRAVVLTGHGGLDKLEYRDDVPVPVPADDEVLIEVAACGMNNTDINTRIGWYSKTVSSVTGGAVTTSESDGSWSGGLTFPRIQGADPAGHVVGVGEGRRSGSHLSAGPCGCVVARSRWLSGESRLSRLRGGRRVRRVRDGARDQRPCDRLRTHRQRSGQPPVLVFDRRAHAAPGRCDGGAVGPGDRRLGGSGRGVDPACPTAESPGRRRYEQLETGGGTRHRRRRCPGPEHGTASTRL